MRHQKGAVLYTSCHESTIQLPAFGGRPPERAGLPTSPEAEIQTDPLPFRLFCTQMTPGWLVIRADNLARRPPAAIAPERTGTTSRILA